MSEEIGRKVRLRTRVIAEKTSTVAAPKPTDELRALVVDIERARLAANEANRIGTNAKKKLFALLDAKNMPGMKLKAKLDDKECVITLVKEMGEYSYVDLVKLKKKLPPEIFMQCIVAQKGLVDKHAGKALREQLEVTEETEETWKIKTEFIK